MLKLRLDRIKMRMQQQNTEQPVEPPLASHDNAAETTTAPHSSNQNRDDVRRLERIKHGQAAGWKQVHLLCFNSSMLPALNTYYLQLNEYIKYFCLLSSSQSTTAFQLKALLHWLCFDAAQGELQDVMDQLGTLPLEAHESDSTHMHAPMDTDAAAPEPLLDPGSSSTSVLCNY